MEGVLDDMQLAGAQGETGALTVTEQRRGAMAASFVRQITGRIAGRLGSRIPAPNMAFLTYLGGLYVELATCYGLGEAYQILELWYVHFPLSLCLSLSSSSSYSL